MSSSSSSSTNTITIYIDFASQPCRAIRIITDRFKVSDKIEWKYLNLLKGEQKRPELMQLNPAGTLPILHDSSNNLSLFESPAIIEYLHNVFGLEGDYGFPKKNTTNNNKEYYQVINALHKHHNMIRSATITLLSPWFAAAFGKQPLPTRQQLNTIIKGVKKTQYKLLNTLLVQNKGFICGFPSVADVFAFTELFQFTKGTFPNDDCNTFHVFEFNDLPAIQDWLNRLTPILFNEELWEQARNFIGFGRKKCPEYALLNDTTNNNNNTIVPVAKL